MATVAQPASGNSNVCGGGIRAGSGSHIHIATIALCGPFRRARLMRTPDHRAKPELLISADQVLNTLRSRIRGGFCVSPCFMANSVLVRAVETFLFFVLIRFHYIYAALKSD